MRTPLLLDAVKLGFVSTGYTAAQNDTGWEALAAIVTAAPGSHIVVTPGTYPVSSPQWTSIVDFTVDLTSASFRTESASSAPPWKLTSCERFDITGGSFAYETVDDNRAAASAGIWFQGCADFGIKRSKVASSRGTGIQLQDCTRYDVEHNTITGTLADGIYQREGCTLGHVIGNVCTNTGDDGVTVASYVDDGSSCSDIWLQDNYITGSQSRGITVSGTRVRILNNTIIDPERHGIYLHTESSNGGFYDLIECQVEGNTVDGHGQDEAQAHGIYLNAGNATYTARDNRIIGNRIVAGFTGSTSHGIRIETQSGTASHHTRCTVAENDVSTSGGFGIQASITDPVVDRNTVRSCRLGGIRIYGAGTARCRNNDLSDLNTTSTASTPGIAFPSSGVTIICTGNTVLDASTRLSQSILATAPTTGVVRANWTPDTTNSLNGSLVTT